MASEHPTRNHTIYTIPTVTRDHEDETKNFSRSHTLMPSTRKLRGYTYTLMSPQETQYNMVVLSQIATLRWANVGSTLYTTMAHGLHTASSQHSFDRWLMVGSMLLYNDDKTLERMFAQHYPNVVNTEKECSNA